MGYAWKGCVAAQADYEVAWSVGLRGNSPRHNMQATASLSCPTEHCTCPDACLNPPGLNDYSYPCANPKECGRLISEAMGNETEWVRAVQPNATVVTYLWDEELGYLKVCRHETQSLLPCEVVSHSVGTGRCADSS